jgi:hypothetical protein
LVDADSAKLCIASGVMPVNSSRLAFIVNNKPVIRVSGVQLAEGLGDWTQKREQALHAGPGRRVAQIGHRSR